MFHAHIFQLSQTIWEMSSNNFDNLFQDLQNQQPPAVLLDTYWLYLYDSVPMKVITEDPCSDQNPEPSSLRGSTLGTTPVEHQDSDWVWIE